MLIQIHMQDGFYVKIHATLGRELGPHLLQKNGDHWFLQMIS